jgi:hypothetical protein
MRLHVSLGFAELPDSDLANFALAVITGMTGNAVYPTPPATATLAMLVAARDAFTQADADAQGGGRLDTAHKNQMRSDLLTVLYALANYVEGACGQNLENLLSSGFNAASQDRRREPLPQPDSVAVKPGQMEGQLVAAVKPAIKNTSLYEGRAKLQGTDTWLPSVFTGDSRHVTFNDLTPGAMYVIQVRALGGSTGASEWSNEVMHRAP